MSSFTCRTYTPRYAKETVYRYIIVFSTGLLQHKHIRWTTPRLDRFCACFLCESRDSRSYAGRCRGGLGSTVKCELAPSQYIFRSARAWSARGRATRASRADRSGLRYPPHLKRGRMFVYFSPIIYCELTILGNDAWWAILMVAIPLYI